MDEGDRGGGRPPRRRGGELTSGTGHAGPRTELQAAGAALAEGIVAAVPGWVERCVERIAVSYEGSEPGGVRAAAGQAAVRAAEQVGAELARLLEADVDEQRSTPLTIVRHAVRFPTEVLREAGVPPVARDGFAEARFPDDVYGLSPASLAELDPGLVDVGIAWGAAKAVEHRRRHGPGAASRGRRL